MKKLRMIIALMIAMVIMCISALPAFASEIAKEKLKELQFKIGDVAEEFNMKVYGSYYPVEGEAFLNYTDETYDNLEAVLNVASRFVIDLTPDVYSGAVEPFDEIEYHMAAIDEAYAQMILEKSELEFLVNFCEAETNNGYYGDKVWSNFTEKLDTAKVILADESIVDTRVNDAFWVLFESYNQLCLYNDVMGDVNGDSAVTVIDATLIQRYIAKLTEFNSSQKFVGWLCTSYSGELDITSATEIQRYIAQLTDNTNWDYYYKELQNSTPRDIHSNLLFSNAMQERYFSSLG